MADPAPDTDDLRSGAPVHDALLALLPLVGRWRGEGNGRSVLSDAEFRYGQQLSFVHDGRPFLAYESRSWITDADGNTVRQAWRESGFWRPGPGQDDIEVILASNTGLGLVYAGTAGDQRWEVTTASVAPAASARHDVDAERRLFALVDGALVYASELAVAGSGLRPHLNARLTRL